jgi:hypothetical protein
VPRHLRVSIHSNVGTSVSSGVDLPSGIYYTLFAFPSFYELVMFCCSFRLGSASDFPGIPTPSRDVTPPRDSYASRALSPMGDDYPYVLRVPPTPSLEDDDLPPTPLPSATPHSGDDTILLSPEAAVLPPVRSDDFDLFEDLPALGSMVLVPYSGPLLLGKLFVLSIHSDLYAS